MTDQYKKCRTIVHVDEILYNGKGEAAYLALYVPSWSGNDRELAIRPISVMPQEFIENMSTKDDKFYIVWVNTGAEYSSQLEFENWEEAPKVPDDFLEEFLNEC